MNTRNINSNTITEEQLNLYIDDQLDKAEMDEIRKLSMDDKNLRERICQLKAVRELVGYAYGDVPRSRVDRRVNRSAEKRTGYAIAASLLLVCGALIGWIGHGLSDSPLNMVNSREVFDYYSNNIPASHAERKIVVHVSTGDLLALKQALDETERLLQSYHDAGAPLTIDIVANKGGINLLRTGISPYADRIARLARNNDNLQFFACARSIAKARKKEGKDFAMLPQAHVARPARELIPERIDKGWIYIKV